MSSNQLPVVISGFPGVGKSHLCKERGWHDSDSSKFSWSSPGVRNPDFPANYIEHIKGLQGVVLVSSHQEVRDALDAADIPFRIVHPALDCKDEYLERYKLRGSPDKFIDLLNQNWDDWVTGLMDGMSSVERYVLQPGEFLGDHQHLLAEIELLQGGEYDAGRPLPESVVSDALASKQ